MTTYIFGHKNPDTDSITSSITYSYLKNKLGYETKPYRLGEINLESRFVLDYFNVKPPSLIDNVKIQLSDLEYDKIRPLKPKVSIQHAYDYMTKNDIKTQPIVNDSNDLVGIVTMRDIAMSLINGDNYKINTSIDNILSDLNAKLINKTDENILGQMFVMAYHYKTIKKNDIINENSVVIVGDRYDAIKLCLRNNAKCVIVTGDARLPDKLIKKCKKSDVNVVITPFDSYTTAKYINRVNFLSSIMSNNPVSFYNDEYLDDFKEEIQNNTHSNYPIVDRNIKYLGMVNRRHILNPSKKEVILVDHNEYRQSAEGLEEADILEIVDHHKLGDISTTLPISFRNSPVGSTNTIIYQMYKENDVEITSKMAGMMLSGIISDTLVLKSPTTTEVDKMAVLELKDIAKVDIDKYAMKMFKKGTSLKGQSIEEIFFKDFKEFYLKEKKVGISQVFTLDIEQVFNRKDEYIDFLNRIFRSKEHDLTLLLVTDIIKEGSYLLYQSKNKKIVPLAFDKKLKQGSFVEKIVSRKKQVIPKIMRAINILD